VAWVRADGELDVAAGVQLGQTLRAAQRSTRVVLDLRGLTFIDVSGVLIVLDAARRARRAGGRLMVVRGPPQVDRLFTLTGASKHILIFDVHADEPSAELLDAA
jgi:anti-sigma B factor antagonist